MPTTLDAVLILDATNLDWRAQLTHEQFAAFLERAPIYNGMKRRGMARLAQRIDDACPRVLFDPGNPNNGERFHKLYVGNECSRVIYVALRYAYLADRLHLAERAFERIRAAARLAGADEIFTESDDHATTLRLWWD